MGSTGCGTEAVAFIADGGSGARLGIVTYQRWETGKAEPQPEHMRQLYGVFGALLASEAAIHALEMSNQKSTSDEEKHSIQPGEEIDEPGAFIVAHMTPHLWSLAFRHYLTCHDRRNAIKQAIKEFDTMNADNKNYQITRREALYSLATLPLITLSLTTPGSTVQPAHYGDALAHCTASVEACWELSKSSDPGDLTLAFKSVSRYLSVLKPIVQESSRYRKEAADVTTQYALLRTILGWHCKGITETTKYAKDAITYSKETGDISLQLSAYSKLAWAYLYDKQYGLALKTAQEAQYLLEQEHQRGAISPCIRGGTYSTLALMQAKNGVLPDSALGKATEIDPGNECVAFMEFTRACLPEEIGYTYCYQGNQVKSMEALEKGIDPLTLTPKVLMSERGRLGGIKMMALSSLKAKDRDMEQTVYFWTAAIETAKALQSEWGFSETLTVYELMEVVWPDEQRIIDLRDLIIHW